MIIGFAEALRSGGSPKASMDSHSFEGIAHLLSALLPAESETRPTRIEYLPGGYTNRNYKVQVGEATYALRVVEGRQPHAAEQGYLALDIAPDVVAYDSTHGHLLTRWIAGDVVANAPMSVDEAAAYLAALHSALPLGPRRYRYAAEVGGFFAQAQQSGLLHQDVATAFERLRWRPSMLCGCHNDLNPWNIIRTTDGDPRFRTLDWESAGDNDALFDLAGLALGTDWPISDALTCLDAYCERRPIALPKAAREARFRDTLCAYRIREYAWAVAQLAAGNARDEIKAQAETMRQAVLANH